MGFLERYFGCIIELWVLEFERVAFKERTVTFLKMH